MRMTTEIDSAVPSFQPLICMIATTLTTIVKTQKIDITDWVRFLVAIHNITKAKNILKKIPDIAEL